MKRILNFVLHYTLNHEILETVNIGMYLHRIYSKYVWITGKMLFGEVSNDKWQKIFFRTNNLWQVSITNKFQPV